jgi:ABC-type transporter MlaC component
MWLQRVGLTHNLHNNQKNKIIMKKFIYLLLLMPLLTIAQINVDNQWKNSINPIFENLDKTKVQSGMLLDYAMEFTDVTAYNGVLTDTTYINANVLGDIYKTLFMSKTKTLQNHFLNFTSIKNNF